MTESLTFTAPHPVKDCISTLVSHQRMPSSGGFGLWVEVSETEPDARYTVYCKLLFGSGTFRPIAWYTLELTRESDAATRVSVVMTDFNYTMAAGFGIISVLGTLFVLFSQALTSGTLILLAVFVGFGIFGYFFTRAQHSDAERLPDTLRVWLDGVSG